MAARRAKPPDPARGTPTTPTVAVGPGLPTRQRTARSPECPPGYFWSCHPTSMPSRSSETTCCTGYSAPPNSSGCRGTASASAVAAWNPAWSTSSTGTARAEARRATFRHPSEQRSRCPLCGRTLAILDAVQGLGDGKFLVLTAARAAEVRLATWDEMGHHPDHDGEGCDAELGADATVTERSSTYSIRNGMRRPTSAPTTSS